jgi:CheY-like chemotaxis protein
LTSGEARGDGGQVAKPENGRTLRFLMVNDDRLVCRLIGRMLEFHFTCEYDAVERGETAVHKLLERRYDLILLDSHLPDVAAADLPADVAALYQTIPKERQFAVSAKRWTEGERLFRLMRSPEARHLGWATDVGSVPVIFLTGGPGSLSQAIIRTMPPVVILPLPTEFQELVDAVEELLAWEA